MFKKKSPVKKKFAVVAKAKKSRRQLDPRTRVLVRQILIGLGALLLIGLLLTAVWYGTRLSFLTISSVTVAGGETIDRMEVEKVTNEVLAGEYAGFIPRRFAWFYPQTEIHDRLLHIPRLKNPVVVRDGTALLVTFEEYYPHALWCAEKDSDDCYFIDNTGYAFTRAPQLKGGAFPRFHTIGTEAKERTQMIPAEDLAAVEVLREAITDNLSLPIAYVETDMMRDVFLGVAGGGEIKATLRQSPEETVTNLKSILGAPEFQDIAPGTFQYIDLRFGNKVFVNETLEVATSSATSSDSATDDVSHMTDSIVGEETNAPLADDNATSSDGTTENE
jgi:cell division septal protein FtsQ